MPSISTPDAPPPPVCPVCGGVVASTYRPFCGQGCRDRDLLQWLSDGHRLPGPPVDEEATGGLDSPPDPRL